MRAAFHLLTATTSFIQTYAFLQQDIVRDGASQDEAQKSETCKSYNGTDNMMI